MTLYPIHVTTSYQNNVLLYVNGLKGTALSYKCSICTNAVTMLTIVHLWSICHLCCQNLVSLSYMYKSIFKHFYHNLRWLFDILPTSQSITNDCGIKYKAIYLFPPYSTWKYETGKVTCCFYWKMYNPHVDNLTWALKSPAQSLSLKWRVRDS